MKELLDSLDEQEAGDMLHYRTLFDEDEDFSQVTCHDMEARHSPCFATIPALSSAGTMNAEEARRVYKSYAFAARETPCLVAVPLLSRTGQGSVQKPFVQFHLLRAHCHKAAAEH